MITLYRKYAWSALILFGALFFMLSCTRAHLSSNAADLALNNGAFYDFGFHSTGTTTRAQIQLANQGATAANSLSTSNLTAPFNFTGGSFPGTNGTCQSTLLAGQSCYLDVQFSPTISQNETQTIFIPYNDGSADTALAATLTGRGVNPGTLDISMASGGIVGYDFDGDDRVDSILLKADGGFVASGQVGLQGALLYANADGSQSAQPAGGALTMPFGLTAGDVMAGSAMDSAGRVIFVGSIGGQFAVARFLGDGTPDTSFNGSGVYRTTLTAGVDQGARVALQPDGKILVVGQTDSAGSNPAFAVVRLNTNGTLDSCFGDASCLSGGKQVFDFGGTQGAGALALALQSDGRIVIAGYTTAGSSTKLLAALRLRADGGLDNTFGASGKMTLSASTAGTVVKAVAMQPDGLIVMSGYVVNAANSDRDFFAVRVASNGSVDTSFATNGLLQLDLSGHFDNEVQAMVIAGQKIYLGGYNNDGVQDRMAVIALNSQGYLDTSFGAQGVVVVPVGVGSSRVRTMAVQADGKILAGGYAYDGVNNQFAILRFFP